MSYPWSDDPITSPDERTEFADALGRAVDATPVQTVADMRARYSPLVRPEVAR